MRIAIYRFTGWQGLFRIPDSWCPECDLLLHATQTAIAKAGADPATLVVRPWFLWFWKPLMHGAVHAPILTVNGRPVSHGTVPPVDTIVAAIESARAEGSRPRWRLWTWMRGI